MKIPQKIKVAGHYYKVIFDDKQLSKEHIVGRINNDFKEIQLCKHYNSKRARAKSEIEETFFHEILHAIDRHYNNGSLSEKAVDSLANGLYQVFNDNFNIKTRVKN